MDEPQPARAADADVALAVDIGGTKMAAALVDAAGAVHERRQRPTGSPSDGDALFEELAALIAEVLAAGAEAGVPAPVVCGCGSGGPMTAGGATVSPVNIGAWRGFPLKARLAEATGLPTAVDNDAKALALGEGWRGGARGRRDYIGMVVSTGVGGGIVLDGRLLDGAAGNAGHIGHMVVEPDGRLCPCGGRGCLEAEASGTAIAEWSGRPAAEATPDVVERVGTLVGRGVASVASLLDLPLALIAGSVALGFGEPFFAAAQREIELRCGLDYARSTVVVPAGLRGDGPLVGAAAVGFRALGVDVLGGAG